MAVPGTREAFTRQPFHYLCVDIGSLPEMAIDSICSGLSDALALTSSIRGSPRIPLFGLAAVDDAATPILTLQNIQGNHANVSKAISDLDALAKNSSGRPLNAVSIKQCIEQARGQLASFRTKNGRNDGKNWQHLQITLMTRQASTHLIKPIEEMMASTREAGSMIRIQVVTLETVLPQAPAALVDSGSNKSSPEAPLNESQDFRNDVFCGLVDTLTLRGNLYDLAGFFKSWLHDHSTDKEHLWLTLPPDPATGKKMTILCDIYELHLNPGAFLFGDHFFLSVDPLVSHGLLTVKTKHSNGSQVGVLKLDAFQLVQTSGICESVVFGIPLRLQPTSCWKMEWSELEGNRQHFQALVQTLLEKDCVLVAQLKQTLHKETPWKTSTLQVYFGVFPADNSLLVKSLVTSELLLPPVDAQVEGDYLPGEAKKRVLTCLETLPLLGMLNPAQLTSGLCDSLRTCLSNSRGFNAAKASTRIEKPGFQSAAALLHKRW